MTAIRKTGTAKAALCRLYLVAAVCLALAFVPTPSAFAQTAATYITQGRSFLAAHDLTNAHSRFASALALSPSHATGNVFYAATRLLTLADRPAGMALLDRLGFSADGRSIYQWTSEPPRDTNGVVIAPTNFSAAGLTAFLRTNLLTEIAGSGSNLAKVTSTSFKLSLTSNETTSTAITLDYGDVVLMRAILEFSRYLGYTIYSWNLDAQLTSIRPLLTQETDLEQLLATHSNLFTFASTNDLNAARQAFTNAVKLYFTASDFIRKRTAGTTRLFNFDDEMLEGETNFRTLLTNLNQAVKSPVVLSFETNITIDLRNHFAGKAVPRSLIPNLSHNSIISGEWPDMSFGGMVQGLQIPEFEHALSDDVHLGFSFRLAGIQELTGGIIRIAFHGLNNHVYRIQYSTDLVEWWDGAWGIAENGTLSLDDLGILPHMKALYYRIVDLTGGNPMTGQVRDITNEQAVPASILVYENGNLSQELGTDDFGNYIFFPNNLWGWYAQVFAGGYRMGSIPWSDSVKNRIVYLAPEGLTPANDFFADRISLSGTNVSVTAHNMGATTTVNEPGDQCVWWSWTAPRTGAILVDTEGSSFNTVLHVYTGSALGSLTEVAYDDDMGTGQSSKLETYVTAGTTYTIAVHTYGSDEGRIYLHLSYTAPRAPVFLDQPESTSLYTGTGFELYAGVTGTQPITFQWKRNGTSISGATDHYYHVENALTTHSGTYTLVAKNATGSTTSASATVTVTTSAPIIYDQPNSASVPIGGYAQFWVGTDGSQPMTYQWKKDGVSITGATDHWMSIPNVTLQDAGAYTVVIKNSYGTTTSSAAILTVY
jgi:hypothetical protein